MSTLFPVLAGFVLILSINLAVRAFAFPRLAAKRIQRWPQVNSFFLCQFLFTFGIAK